MAGRRVTNDRVASSIDLAKTLVAAHPSAIAYDDRMPERTSPRVGVFAVLGVVLAGCCLATGLLSMLGSVLALTGRVPHDAQADPATNLVCSALAIALPGALLLVACVRVIRRTRAMQRLVALAETRTAIDAQDVARALDLGEDDARAMLDRAVREGYVDRALVEATVRDGARDALPMGRAVGQQREGAEGSAAEVPLTAESVTRICAFCKAETTLPRTALRPRCAGCGIPFGSRA